MSALAAAAVPESSDVDDGTPPGMLELEGAGTVPSLIRGTNRTKILRMFIKSWFNSLVVR